MSTPKERGWGEPGQVPRMTIRRTDGVGVTMHAQLAELTALLLDLTELVGYDLRVGECWGYNRRTIAGTATWSNHAWGVAIDLNAPSNWRGGRGDIPDAVVDLWQGNGWTWGGMWKNTDPMHFEFSGTPTDAKYITARLREFLATPVPTPTTKVRSKMFMLIDERDNTVWLYGAGAPMSLGGRPTEYQRLLALGIPVTVDDGLLVDFLRA